MSENDGSYSEQNASGALGDILSKYPVLRSPADVERNAVKYVYFVQVGETGPIKIGIASDVRQRVLNLQTANYQDVRLLGWVSGTQRDERLWQAKFDKHCLQGEWFAPHPDVIAGIEEHCHLTRRLPKNDPMVLEIAKRLVLARALDGRWQSCLDFATEIIAKVRGLI